jgi:hypothetical protein
VNPGSAGRRRRALSPDGRAGESRTVRLRSATATPARPAKPPFGATSTA